MANKLTPKTIKDIEKVLTLAIEQKINLKAACSQLGCNTSLIEGTPGQLGTKLRDAVKNKNITAGQAKVSMMLMGQFLALGKKISDKAPTSPKETKKSLPKEDSDDFDMTPEEEQEMLDYDASTDEAYEDRSVGEIVRGNETFVDYTGTELKKITGYKYRIFIRDEQPLEGNFTREEMDRIYRLYSNMDGAGMTLRAVSRQFNHLTFKDFKRILRAFNITKASIPVAPHLIEENTPERLKGIIFQNKENNLFKKMDDERGRHYEKEYYKKAKQVFEISTDQEWVEKRIEAYFSKKRPALPAPVSRKIKDLNQSDKPLFCFFGDIHYGKKFERTIFGRGYSKEIAHDRVMQIAHRTIAEAKLLNPREIVMVSMGDLLECAMEDGMHAGHTMEMYLFQEEQIFFATDSIVEMMKLMIAKTNCKITFCSIHGNHDRIGIKRDDDKSRTAGKVVTGMVKRMLANESNFSVEMPENNLLRLKRGKICLFAHHGDSALNKKKPSELVNIWGEGTACYHVLLKGHWHSLKADEGTNYLTLTTPSVASADKFILEELGNNNLPGFILGHEPECYGFDYKKITLY
jgi:hypothetical protein